MSLTLVPQCFNEGNITFIFQYEIFCDHVIICVYNVSILLMLDPIFFVIPELLKVTNFWHYKKRTS
jgi:hypothetical protein